MLSVLPQAPQNAADFAEKKREKRAFRQALQRSLRRSAAPAAVNEALATLSITFCALPVGQLAEDEAFGERPFTFKRRDRNVESLGGFLFSKPAQKTQFDNLAGSPRNLLQPA